MVPEAVPAVVHGDEAFLHHFFRRRLVPDEQGCRPDQRTIVAGVQLRDRLIGRQLSPSQLGWPGLLRPAREALQNAASRCHGERAGDRSRRRPRRGRGRGCGRGLKHSASSSAWSSGILSSLTHASGGRLRLLVAPAWATVRGCPGASCSRRSGGTRARNCSVRLVIWSCRAARMMQSAGFFLFSTAGPGPVVCRTRQHDALAGAGKSSATPTAPPPPPHPTDASSTPTDHPPPPRKRAPREGNPPLPPAPTRAKPPDGGRRPRTLRSEPPIGTASGVRVCASGGAT